MKKSTYNFHRISRFYCAKTAKRTTFGINDYYLVILSNKAQVKVIFSVHKR